AVLLVLWRSGRCSRLFLYVDFVARRSVGGRRGHFAATPSQPLMPDAVCALASPIGRAATLRRRTGLCLTSTLGATRAAATSRSSSRCDRSRRMATASEPIAGHDHPLCESSGARCSADRRGRAASEEATACCCSPQQAQKPTESVGPQSPPPA